MAKNSKVDQKKALAKAIKKTLRHGGNVCVYIVDHWDRLVLVTVFTPKMSARERKAEIRNAVLAQKYSKRSILASVGNKLSEFDFYATDIDLRWWPGVVLEALMDESQFNRGRGGKSVNAIVKCLDMTDTPISHASVRKGLDELVRMGLVVQAITGAYWPKEWFRDTMRELGISYLPTVL